MSKKPKDSDFEYSSGNVFADLELPNADKLLTRAKLGHTVLKEIKARELTKFRITGILKINQHEASELMNCNFFLFSESRLIKFLGKLRPDNP